MSITINVGHKNYGYRPLPLTDTERILSYYMNDVPKKIKGGIVEANRKMAIDILSGKKLDWKRYEKIAMTSLSIIIASTTLNPSVTMAMSPQGMFDLGPIKTLSNEFYFAMLELVLYFTSPVFAWAGYVLFFSGKSSDKRTLAKTIAMWATIGIGLVVAAPWVGNMAYGVWVKIFSEGGYL